jgi:hypothetical protein
MTRRKRYSAEFKREALGRANEEGGELGRGCNFFFIALRGATIGRRVNHDQDLMILS